MEFQLGASWKDSQPLHGRAGRRRRGLSELAANDLSCDFGEGLLPDSAASNTLSLRLARDITIPADFAGSVGGCEVNPTNAAAFDVADERRFQPASQPEARGGGTALARLTGRRDIALTPSAAHP